jgi:hypothetical protein
MCGRTVTSDVAVRHQTDTVEALGSAHGAALRPAWRARRAGVSLAMLSSGLNWFLGFEGEGELVLVAPASFDRPLDRIDLQRRCPHGLADAVLGGLIDLLDVRGGGGDATHALELRSYLRAAQRMDAPGRD